jgi:hypothetical protein
MRHAQANRNLALFAATVLTAACDIPGTPLESGMEEGSSILDYGAEGNAAAAADAANFSHGCGGPADKATPVVVTQSFSSWQQDDANKPVPNATNQAADLERQELSPDPLPAVVEGDKVSMDTATQPSVVDQQPVPQYEPPAQIAQAEPPATEDIQAIALQSANSGGGGGARVDCGYRMINGQNVYVANVVTPVNQHAGVFVNKVAADLDAGLILGSGEDASLKDKVRIDGAVRNQLADYAGYTADGRENPIYTPLLGSEMVDGLGKEKIIKASGFDAIRPPSANGKIAEASGSYPYTYAKEPDLANNYACASMLATLAASRNNNVTTAGGQVKLAKHNADVVFAHVPAYNADADAAAQQANAQRIAGTRTEIITNWLNNRPRSARGN